MMVGFAYDCREAAEFFFDKSIEIIPNRPIRSKIQRYVDECRFAELPALMPPYSMKPFVEIDSLGLPEYPKEHASLSVRILILEALQ